ncbi:tyrosine--tRNA ligase [Anaerotignum propionicum]|uniref:Tyrosine--tRNA ligase n=1 Tax=Anaerotignum propionicum DSM 1682 TaxID=991789 RepID=A0A110A7G5_ANAPI|nr:tyrosine--tRNA ligase [Anaerotignum propionicum]AMJ42037.1 tyrosine--tRNA ligase [Anaerotignum propionicum DSM 1682]SHE50036.1 tyrosyl-tRNA synthetase [[Clostridium] propionicum DSM 1682] [Anaerotignum propionicum DSM 1682]
MNAYEVLKERGFIEQLTHEDEIKALFQKGGVTFYIGIDPTADSLHVGHFLTVMAMAHMQQCGNRPICLMGGGTGMIGDPSGKADMRKMMTVETIDQNVACIKKQLSRFINFDNDKAIIVNNADWLRNLNYIEFLRDVGVHFTVNRMLAADCFKTRMDKEAGLSFLEFNYMIMQGYDFLELYNRHNCIMQLGGSDQWSNILAGVRLIRSKLGKPAYGMTFKLLTNSDGVKMGKTVGGAVWLDPEKTTPYDFYQYWRNIGDKDVEKCLALLTFLPMDEVRRLGALPGSEINQAKEVLAFELTKIVHGEEEATKAQEAARALFGKGAVAGSVPTTELSSADFAEGMDILTLLTTTGVVPSRSEGRRAVQQGGVKVADQAITDVDFKVTENLFTDGKLLLQKGKKVFHNVVLK